ncbi:MOSC domain-containing protein [Spirulina sp. CS-785/01]|uniref:MOSC domain-containing protein n=1 Tax=Spirulina sp. CS-785/01 TaxID=3021716 RepID=UPI002330E623|nr:MOSC domain-containing protein [Spirulina sp. CS-785/01]MDB9311953.1 MOSC domain-containing protein [Spirulina sp. CS-785/01]
MQLTQISVYPIKSCRGVSLESAEVTLKGFKGDRELMIVDENGIFITQRQYPQLALIEVERKGETVMLSSCTGSPAAVTFPLIQTGEKVGVEIWRDRTLAIDQGNTPAQWLQAFLQTSKNIRLMGQSPDHIRPIDPQYSPSPQHPVSFADGYPFLLTNTASLAELNRRINANYNDTSQAVPMNRFRPNLVMETEHPFIEDTWTQVKIGEVVFDVVKPCSRCIITTTDQKTAQRNELKEPLKTLSTFRQKGGKIFFGQNLIPRNTGVVRIFDEVLGNG